MHDPNQNPIDIPTFIENEENLPFYMTPGAAGADVKAHLNEPLIIPARQSALIPTGMRIAIPEGYEIQIRPRSGLALKHQITVLNTPGTIDADYRGEIKIILINHGMEDFISDKRNADRPVNCVSCSARKLRLECRISCHRTWSGRIWPYRLI